MKKETTMDRIISHLNEYGSITSWEAIEKYGCTRLSGYIFILRKDGYKINSVDINTKNRYGRNVHYVRYELVEE